MKARRVDLRLAASPTTALRQACLALLVSGLVAGCVGRSDLRPLPPDWGALSGRSLGMCPDLRGTFRAEGVEAGLQEICPRGVADAGQWHCSRRLDEQFRFERPATQVRIDQTDADSIALTAIGPEGAQGTRTFSRSRGDYACEAGGLVFRSTGSFFSDENTQSGPGESAMATIGGLMILRGGVRTLEKALYVSELGELVMNVTVTNAGVIFPLPFRASFSAWVKWPATAP